MCIYIYIYKYHIHKTQYCRSKFGRTTTWYLWYLFRSWSCWRIERSIKNFLHTGRTNTSESILLIKNSWSAQSLQRLYLGDVCIYVRMYVCMHVCKYVCMYVCMYVGMHVGMHICIYEHWQYTSCQPPLPRASPLESGQQHPDPTAWREHNHEPRLLFSVPTVCMHVCMSIFRMCVCM